MAFCGPFFFVCPETKTYKSTARHRDLKNADLAFEQKKTPQKTPKKPPTFSRSIIVERGQEKSSKKTTQIEAKKWQF